ncbi:hypothetical protein V5799_000860 [Amblyomma americanum]|uniref:SKI/SNO/DAC domain-containing protein n=1 Tax=Amblyomma americanum TaxID=6943 RepID=A0AAQ4D1T8_AMBAM
MEPAGHAAAAAAAPVDLSRSASGLSPPVLNGGGPGPATTLSGVGLTPPGLGAGLSLLPSLYAGGRTGDYGVPSSGEATECRLVEYRGERVAAFVQRSGELLLCLPQAFELFLKHLVGGLHTVYTKLKRLGISPIVCNVEQVRILRGLGAIQPGVNRCKLLACRDFDALYRDCTTASSRPGRPPKRSGILLGLAGAAQHQPTGSAMPTLQAIKKLRPDGDFASTYVNGEAYGERGATLLLAPRTGFGERCRWVTFNDLRDDVNQPDKPLQDTELCPFFFHSFPQKRKKIVAQKFLQSDNMRIRVHFLF